MFDHLNFYRPSQPPILGTLRFVFPRTSVYARTLITAHTLLRHISPRLRLRPPVRHWRRAPPTLQELIHQPNRRVPANINGARRRRRLHWQCGRHLQTASPSRAHSKPQEFVESEPPVSVGVKGRQRSRQLVSLHPRLDRSHRRGRRGLRASQFMRTQPRVPVGIQLVK